MATVGQDLFTEGSNTALESHTPDVGAGWTVESASFTVRSATDDVDHTSTTTHRGQKGDDIGAADMDVSADVKSTTSSSRLAGVCGRMASGAYNNQYEAYITGDGSACDVYLFKNVSGSRTQIGADTTLNAAANTFGTIKLSCIGTTIKVYWNGVEKISVTDADIATGNYAGIIQNGGSGGSANVRIDNFLSESIAVAAGNVNLLNGLFYGKTAGKLSH